MGLRQFFQRVLPAHHEIRSHRQLQFLGDILHDPNIFHLTRHSCAGGVATGLFVAFLPVPGHMVIAALVAIWFRVNLPLSVALVWVTNPVTIPPVFFVAYEFGRILLGRPHHAVKFEFTLHWFTTTFVNIWPSLALGSLILATVASVVGYVTVQLIWRLSIVRKWEQRARQRARDRRSKT
jgi:uncharacterized protein